MAEETFGAKNLKKILSHFTQNKENRNLTIILYNITFYDVNQKIIHFNFDS